MLNIRFHTLAFGNAGKEDEIPAGPGIARCLPKTLACVVSGLSSGLAILAQLTALQKFSEPSLIHRRKEGAESSHAIKNPGKDQWTTLCKEDGELIFSCEFKRKESYKLELFVMPATFDLQGAIGLTPVYTLHIDTTGKNGKGTHIPQRFYFERTASLRFSCQGGIWMAHEVRPFHPQEVAVKDNYFYPTAIADLRREGEEYHGGQRDYFQQFKGKKRGERVTWWRSSYSCLSNLYPLLSARPEDIIFPTSNNNNNNNTNNNATDFPSPIYPAFLELSPSLVQSVDSFASSLEYVLEGSWLPTQLESASQLTSDSSYPLLGVGHQEALQACFPGLSALDWQEEEQVLRLSGVEDDALSAVLEEAETFAFEKTIGKRGRDEFDDDLEDDRAWKRMTFSSDFFDIMNPELAELEWPTAD